MVKLVIIILLSMAGSAGGIWGGLYFANSVAASDTGENGHEVTPKIEFLTPDLFVVPVVSRDDVRGFLVCRLAFAINAAKPANATISEDTIMTDLFYEIAFKGTAYIPGETKVPNLAGIADGMLARLNEVSGNERYTAVYVQQVDFFERDEVRRKVVEDRFAPGD